MNRRRAWLRERFYAGAWDSEYLKAASLERKKRNNERIGIIFALGRVLCQVSVNYIHQRKRVVTMYLTDGLYEKLVG